MFTIYLKKNRIWVICLSSRFYRITHIMNLQYEFYMLIIFPIPCICVVFVSQEYIDMLIFYDFKGQLIFYVGGSSSSHDRHIIIE